MWQRLRTNASYSVIAMGITAALGIGSMFFNARALGVELLGVYASVLALSLMLEALSGSQLWQAVVALGNGREPEILGAALAINAGTGLIAALAGFAVLSLTDIQGGWTAYILIATLIVRFPDPVTGLLRRHDRFGLIAFVQALAAFLAAIAAMTFWYFNAELYLYFLSAAAIAILNFAILLGATLRHCRPVMPSSSALREVLAFAVPTSLSGAIGALRVRGIVLMLAAISGAAATGLYAVAERIGSVMQMAYRALFEAVFREMSDAEKPVILALGVGAGGLLLSIVATIGAYLLGDFVVTIVAGPDFITSAQVLVLLIVASGVTLTFMGLRALIIVKLGPKAMLACNAISALTLLAAPVLIAEYGVLGAAYTHILFEVTWIVPATLVFLYWSRREGYLHARKPIR